MTVGENLKPRKTNKVGAALQRQVGIFPRMDKKHRIKKALLINISKAGVVGGT